MSWLLLLVACSVSTPVAPAPKPAGPYWAERSDAELDAELSATCERAVASGKPVLLAFSAPWCIDCRTLRLLEDEPPLVEELARWEKVVVHVGRFDRHAALREAFGVDRIVYWSALRPTSCSRPASEWPVLRKGVFEPKSDPDGPRTPAAVAAWLAEARG